MCIYAYIYMCTYVYIFICVYILKAHTHVVNGKKGYFGGHRKHALSK